MTRLDDLISDAEDLVHDCRELCDDVILFARDHPDREWCEVARGAAAAELMLLDNVRRLRERRERTDADLQSR